MKASRDNTPSAIVERRSHAEARVGARAVCIAGLALAVAACGSSSHKPKNTASTTPVTTAATTTHATHAASHSRPKHHRAKSHTHTTRTSTTHTTPSHTTTTHTTTTPTHTTTTPTYAKPLHATLVGENHKPAAGKLWTYTVTATDANGRPLTGSVYTEFAFQGVVVGHEVPPTHPLSDGRLVDQVTFPADAIGHAIDLQVVVNTSIGSVTLDWSVVAHAKK